MESDLGQRHDELSVLISAAPGVLYVCKPEGDFAATFVSSSVDAQLGYDSSEFTSDAKFWSDHIHPEDKERVFTALGPLFEQGSHTHEYRFRHADGAYRWMHDQLRLFRDSDGAPARIVGVWSDITDRKESEQRLTIAVNERTAELKQANQALLTEIDARKQGEDRLRQAQKMEAVGQLTGGIAHDFNNLLAVIMGNSELLEDQLGREDVRLGAILRAATRGSELTQRLLAFSRQQPLRPQAIDLGSLVSGMSDMLVRTLGATIDIESIAAPRLWAVSADPGQVENALLNLVLNARDAMPVGGKLTIHCENAPLDEDYVAQYPEILAGDYVSLAMCDSGTGMPAEIRAKAFEPFFTTKDIGEGSGLGLSMVYGFARQSGGHATIYSEIGRGTTVKLYLPRAGDVRGTEEVRRDAGIPHGQGEVILVVEDDSDVRELAVKMLKRLGYQVNAVADAATGHAFLADGAQLDLLFSDVVLPGGTSGPEFADEARKIRPGLKVIFMSGYPAEAAKRNGFLGSDKVLLNKPFQMRQLALALREALD